MHNAILKRTSGIRGIDRRLLKIQFSFFLMVIGGRFNQLAIAWWTLQETQSVASFSTMIACAIGAEVLSKPLLGWLGDKYNKINIIKYLSFISLLTTLVMFALSFSDAFSPWAIGSLMVIGSSVVGVRDPLQASIIPLFVTDDKVSLAFRTRSVMMSFSILLGPVLASGAIYSLGITPALLADLLAVVFACLLIINIPSHTGDTSDQTHTPPKGIKMIYDGFKILIGVKVELHLALIAMLINFALFPFFTILIPLYIKETRNLPVFYVGFLDSCFGLGILLGSYKIISWLTPHVPRDLCVSSGFACLGCNLVIVGTCDSIAILAAAFFLGGIGLMLINIPTSAVRLLATPKAYRNRIFATVSFLSAVASPFGSATMNCLISSLGIPLTITFLGSIIISLSLLVLIIPDFKEFMRTHDTKLSDGYLLKYPTVFKPQPTF